MKKMAESVGHGSYEVRSIRTFFWHAPSAAAISTTCMPSTHRSGTSALVWPAGACAAGAVHVATSASCHRNGFCTLECYPGCSSVLPAAHMFAAVALTSLVLVQFF